MKTQLDLDIERFQKSLDYLQSVELPRAEELEGLNDMEPQLKQQLVNHPGFKGKYPLTYQAMQQIKLDTVLIEQMKKATE